MQYRDFEIMILPQGDDGFSVHVSSPAGEDQDVFRLPFDERTLSHLIPDLSRSAARGTTRSPAPVEPPPETMMPPQDVGRQLFEALFTDKVRSLFDWSLGRLDPEKDEGLRIKLRFDPDAGPGLERLSRLPWEYMYRHDRREYLSLSMHTPVVRYLEVPRPPEPLPLKLPLRILYVLASPIDQLELDLDREKTLIEKALRDQVRAKNVEFDILEHATVADLLRMLDEKDYHVIHYMGHGCVDAASGQGALCLEKEDGLSDYFPAGKLMTLLHDRKTVRLVFLNACQTAGVPEDEAEHGDAFMGVAPALVMGGATAVIAMQFPISDEAAMAFSDALYTQLAKTTPVDEAVSKARQAVQARTKGQEWGTPVLFMRAEDGKIFDIPTDVVRLGPLTLPRKVAILVGGGLVVIVALTLGLVLFGPGSGGKDTPTPTLTATTTATETPTPTGTATDTPTPTSTLTPTPSSTLTPTPTSTPTATWTPTLTPTVPLPDQLDQPWNMAWTRLPNLRDKLGHVVFQGERLRCVRQQFERGFMLWCDLQHGSHRSPEGWEGPNQVFVIDEASGWRAWWLDDPWTIEEGTTPCGDDLERELEDAPELTGSFRKVWCRQDAMRPALGLPVGVQSNVPRLLRENDWGPGVMEFEGGYMLWDTHTGRLWVLVHDSGWSFIQIGPATLTPSPTPTSLSPTPSPSATLTPSSTPTTTPSPTASPTAPTVTPTRTGMPSPTPTRTPYVTPTRTGTPSPTPTPTPYLTPTRTVYPSPTP